MCGYKDLQQMKNAGLLGYSTLYIWLGISRTLQFAAN
jgi:hypothetical protein